MTDTGQNISREDALERVKAIRACMGGLAAYVIVNVFLWILWALTKGDGGGGTPPWPIWVTVGWGIGMAFGAWNVYGRKPITEAEIDKEMSRGNWAGARCRAPSISNTHRRRQPGRFRP